MKYLYTLLCLLVGTAQAGQIPQTLTNLTNTVVQSRLVQGITQNSTFQKISTSPITDKTLSTAAALGGFCAGTGTFLAFMCTSKEQDTDEYIDAITSVTDKTLEKTGVSKTTRRKIQNIPSALLFGLGTIALGRLELKNHYANIALGSALIPFACLGSITRSDALKAVYSKHNLSLAFAPASIYLSTKHRYAVGTVELFASISALVNEQYR